MSTDITTTNLPTQFVHPGTGEVIDIGDAEAMERAATDAPDLLALMLETIDQHMAAAQDARAYVAEFLMERMDRDATQTLHAGDYTLTVNGSSDTYESYDAEALRAGLAALVVAGVLSDAAITKAVRTKYEASKSGINSLRALRDEQVDAAIDAATTQAVRRRRVTVKRAGR